MVVELKWVEPRHSTGYCWWADAGECQYRISRVAGIKQPGVDEFRTERGTPDSCGARFGFHWHSFGPSWFPSLAAAQAECADHAQHEEDVKALGRWDFRPTSYQTPWGVADHAVSFSGHLVFYSTPSHGGFWVSADARRRMPAELANADGSAWFEEDCEWCRVALAFPEWFTTREHRLAQQTYDEWCTPEARARHQAQMAAWRADVRARG